MLKLRSALVLRQNKQSVTKVAVKTLQKSMRIPEAPQQGYPVIG